ncbi:MAG: phosphatidate cytidylyltransferase [Bacteroidetes bacterium]|nr:phosphatidate cytidylyltransferase [Bacteroidota bacterium]
MWIPICSCGIGRFVFQSTHLWGTFLIVSIGCINEYYNIVPPFFKRDSPKINLYKYLGLLIGTLFFLISYFIALGVLDLRYMLLFPSLLLSFFILELFINSKRPFRNIGINLVGIIYICTSFSLLHYLTYYNGQYIGQIIIGIILCVWMNDTGAYVLGSLIGKHKLVPNISPNNTIEGSLGGLIATLLTAYLVSTYLSTYPGFENLQLLNLMGWMCVAIIVIIFASMGDLVESQMKRSLKIKDSGSIMPGHGGFLDRFDAFIFVIPFIVAFFVLYIK